MRAKYNIYKWGLIVLWQAIIRNPGDGKKYAGLGLTKKEAKNNAVKAASK